MKYIWKSGLNYCQFEILTGVWAFTLSNNYMSVGYTCFSSDNSNKIFTV